jgi:RNA polymerase sigma factor (sigma-70 family)
MATARSGAVLRQIRGLAAERPENQRPDAELLQAFLARRDQAAFEALVRRHGPLVLRVCWRTLGGLPDAEDAFQATFLFLAQRAGSIRKRASLASWLHGVARRMATNARRSAARRTRHERQACPPPAADPAWQAAWREVQAILDEEIQRLPETYREPLVRCCLEHRSCAEVATQMGLQEPTVRSRVSRARKLLERRLARRGVSLTVLSAAVAVAGSRAAAEVAPKLLRATAAAAVHLTSPQGAADGMVSARVVALLDGMNQAMALARIKTALVVLLGTALLAAGAVLVYGRGLSAERGEGGAGEPPASQGPAEPHPGDGRRTDLHGDPLPHEALARLGTTRFRPGEHVSLLRFTPDGTKLVTQGAAGLRVWDVATGRELRRFGPAAGTTVACGDLSADGAVAATGDAGREGRGALRLWDVGAGRQLRVYGDAGPCSLVRLTPDGKTIAAVGLSGGVDLWDATTGERRHTLKGHEGRIWSAAFSADGKTLVTGGADKTLRTWDVATGRELLCIADCPELVGSVALSPDGRLLASVGYRETSPGPGITSWLPDSRVRVWDASTGKELRQLVVGAGQTGHGAAAGSGVVAVAFAPDGKTLVTVGMDYVLRVWDVTAGKELRAFPGCSTNSGALALAPDGKWAAFANGGTTVRVVDLATGKDRVPLPGHAGGVWAAAVTPDGRRIVTAGGDASVSVWEAATGRELRRLRGHEGYVAGLALAPDGRSLYTLGSDRRLRAWDLTDGSGRLLSGDRGVRGLVLLALSANGKLLAAGHAEKALVLIDAASGEPVRTAVGLEGRLCVGAGFVPGGRTLVAWNTDQAVHVLDVATGKVRKEFPFAGDEDRRMSYAAALSPDGRLVAFGSQARFLSVQELETGKEVCRFDRLPDGVSSVAFSPDGRTLAWGGWNDPTVHLIELSTRQERHHFTGHKGRVLALHFSPDGRVLVSGGSDATALVWDLAGPPAAGDRDLSAEELASLWKDLGAVNAAQAYQSVRRLARSGAAVEFLGTKMEPVPAPEERRLAKLIADLDSDQFDVRGRATQELERLGEQAVGACRKALAGRPSPEMRRRLEALLDRQAAEARRPSAERVRLMRALEALELAGPGRAREVLAALARGAPGAWLTEEARAARQRLDRRRMLP